MTKKKPKSEHKKAGRPLKITPEVVNKLEHAFSLGCSDLEACFYAEISKQTLYDYQERNPDFADRKAMLKEKMIFKARDVIAKALEKKDENTAKWYLERKKKDEFSTKVEQSIQAQGFSIQVADDKTKQQLEDL